MSKEELDVLEDLRGHFARGEHFIAPGFFRLLMTLQRQKREFAVVFRTFGEDLPKVLKEFRQ